MSETVVIVLGVIVFACMVAGAWFGRAQLMAHPIRAFALLLVAVNNAFVMYMAFILNGIITGPNWCRTAYGVDKATGTASNLDISAACVGLLTIQLKSGSTNSHILFGVVALSQLVLVVVVLASGRLSGSVAGVGNLSLSSSADAAAAAADTVATAAVDTAKQVKDAAKVEPTPEPTYNGPAMPEPPAKKG